MTAPVRPAERPRDDEALEEERRRLVKMLQEGMEDVRAGRVVTSEELDRALEEARTRRLARRGEKVLAR